MVKNELDFFWYFTRPFTSKNEVLCSKNKILSYEFWVDLSYDIVHKWAYLCKFIAYEHVFMSLECIVDIWSFCDINCLFKENAHSEYALWNMPWMFEFIIFIFDIYPYLLLIHHVLIWIYAWWMIEFLNV